MAPPFADAKSGWWFVSPEVARISPLIIELGTMHRHMLAWATTPHRFTSGLASAVQSWLAEHFVHGCDVVVLVTGFGCLS